MNQDHCIKRLTSLSLENDYCGSFDLSAATDRLPVLLQRDILTHFLGEDTSYYWIKLIVDRYWDFKGEKIKYGVGQPIGAYSS